MKTILVFLLLAVRCFAAEITLQWDANPIEEETSEYRIYRQTGPDSWESVAQVAGDVTQVTLTLPAGRHTFAATSVNQWGESIRSVPVSTPLLPTPPKGGKIKTLKLTLQSSRDMQNWNALVSFEIPWEQNQLFRCLFTD